MGKHSDQSGPLGNTDPDKRGRGGHDDVGQKVPDKVRKQIEPKHGGKGAK